MLPLAFLVNYRGDGVKISAALILRFSATTFQWSFAAMVIMTVSGKPLELCFRHVSAFISTFGEYSQLDLSVEI